MAFCFGQVYKYLDKKRMRNKDGRPETECPFHAPLKEVV